MGRKYILLIEQCNVGLHSEILHYLSTNLYEVHSKKNQNFFKQNF